LLTYAYSVNRFSEHPLARAIVKRAEETGLEAIEVTDFSALVGFGAKAKIGGETHYVGKPELFEQLGLGVRTIPEILQLASAGKTVVLVGTEKNITGLIAIRDEIQREAKEAIEGLHKMGIKVVMLTGDNETTAQAIAKEAGIDEVRANLKAADKIRVVEELEKNHRVVAMVGDGINDAPALARATVGIAMGVAGTDAALEAADTALMADDLKKPVYAVNLGKKARQISNQNIVFSVLPLAVLVPCVLIGIMTVAFAVFAHETSELLAVSNGLRVAGELSA
jgi:P-type E1-E2 ATPase